MGGGFGMVLIYLGLLGICYGLIFFLTRDTRTKEEKEHEWKGSGSK